MSYKAFAKLKEHIEAETIKNMTPEEINGVLTTQHSRIKDLESQNAEMLELLKELQWRHDYFFTLSCFYCGCQKVDGHDADCKLGNLLKRF